MPAAQLCHRKARLRFPQEAYDLLFGTSRFRVQSLVYGIGLQAQLLLKTGGGVGIAIFNGSLGLIHEVNLIP